MNRPPKQSRKRKKPKLPTRIEREVIQENVQKLLDLRTHVGAVKRVIAERYGLSPRSVEPYLRRARVEKLEATGKPIEEHRSDSFAFYQAIVADPKAPVRDRIRAQQSIDRLLGLCMPVKMDASGVLVNTTPEELSRMDDEQLQRFYSSLAGLGRDGNPGQAKP